jgi:hypothetical protein
MLRGFPQSFQRCVQGGPPVQAHEHGNRRKALSMSKAYVFNTYFTSVVQQPYGYIVTGQLQEPKDLIRPATAKVVFTTKVVFTFNRPRLRYYKRSSSFNPRTRFLEHSAE